MIVKFYKNDFDLYEKWIQHLATYAKEWCLQFRNRDGR